MNEFDKSIIEIITKNPGIKARDIAQKLNCTRKEINSALYGRLKNILFPKIKTIKKYVNSVQWSWCHK